METGKAEHPAGVRLCNRSLEHGVSLNLCDSPRKRVFFMPYSNGEKTEALEKRNIDNLSEVSQQVVEKWRPGAVPLPISWAGRWEGLWGPWGLWSPAWGCCPGQSSWEAGSWLYQDASLFCSVRGSLFFQTWECLKLFLLSDAFPWLSRIGNIFLQKKWVHHILSSPYIKGYKICTVKF